MTAANRDPGALSAVASLEVTSPESSTADRELVSTRVFDAPRELVFLAWTDPARIARWWGPRGFTTSTYAMDVRPGGAWRFVLRGPDGQEHPFKGVYREVVPPERVVATFIYDVDFIRDSPALETVTFEEYDGKTILKINVLHQSKEARDGHLHSGMESGANQSYDRLSELLKTMA
jgi:uncharacterized protein YndB with AHSA1/START domain